MAHLKISNPSQGSVSAACLKPQLQLQLQLPLHYSYNYIAPTQKYVAPTQQYSTLHGTTLQYTYYTTLRYTTLD